MGYEQRDGVLYDMGSGGREAIIDAEGRFWGFKEPNTPWQGIQPIKTSLSPVGGAENMFTYTDPASGSTKYFLPSYMYNNAFGPPGSVGGGKSPVQQIYWPTHAPTTIAGGKASGSPGANYQYYGEGADNLSGWSFDADPRTSPGFLGDTFTPDDPFWSGMLSAFAEGPMIPLAGFLGAGALGGALAGAESGFGAGALGSWDAVGGLTAAEAASLGGGAAGTTAGKGGGMLDWLTNLFSSGVPAESTIPELGLIADGATGAQAIAQGIPAEMLTANFAGTPWYGLTSEIANKLTQKVGTEAAKSLMQKVFSGSATAAELAEIAGLGGTTWQKLLGSLGPAALGAYGANQQSNDLKDLAEKYMGFGAPSRARYEASMTPGFDPMSIPGYAGALDSTSKNVLARLSATGGNPFGNPGGLIDANKQIVSGTALPAINEYQRLNANTGFGQSMNAGGNYQAAGIGADQGIYGALGYGLGNLLNPPKTGILEQIFRSYGGTSI